MSQYKWTWHRSHSLFLVALLSDFKDPILEKNEGNHGEELVKIVVVMVQDTETEIGFSEDTVSQNRLIIMFPMKRFHTFPQQNSIVDMHRFIPLIYECHVKLHDVRQ